MCNLKPIKDQSS
uniref:Uncharacterized protein n=1 Tax=Anguilla anguilla TaxID=7936 RepID=A0A0E9QUJ4_ANGAN